MNAKIEESQETTNETEADNHEILMTPKKYTKFQEQSSDEIHFGKQDSDLNINIENEKNCGKIKIPLLHMKHKRKNKSQTKHKHENT